MQVRDPVERFISRFNYNRWRPYNTKDIQWVIPETTNSNFCLFEHRTQVNTHHLTYLFPRDLVDENAWMLGTKFYANQQRERGVANLTACILDKLPECVYQVCSWELYLLPIFVFLTQSKYYQIQGHGASEPEIVQGWLPGVSPPLHPKYVFFFLKKFQLLVNSHHHRFPGFAELQKPAGPWVTWALCK